MVITYPSNIANNRDMIWRYLAGFIYEQETSSRISGGKRPRYVPCPQPY